MASLQARKQELVRNEIYKAAIELFLVEGFEATTIDDIARAAGVSRRSMFRYFRSKNDLLAHSVMSYRDALVAAIHGCAPLSSPLSLLRQAVASAALYVGSHPLSRKVIRIASDSIGARQAHQSRMPELADSLSEAFALKLAPAKRSEDVPHMLAELTILIMNVAIRSWYLERYSDLPAAAEKTLGDLAGFFRPTAGFDPQVM